jgi:uncharacterized protein YciI
MKFDSYTVSLLLLRPDAPQLAEAEANALQDRHLDHGATLQDQGLILARGPLVEQDDPRMRGFTVWSVDQQAARQLANQDPGVLEGRFEVQVMTWLMPAGNLSFGTVKAPHSIADARADD